MSLCKLGHFTEGISFCDNYYACAKCIKKIMLCFRVLLYTGTKPSQRKYIMNSIVAELKNQTKNVESDRDDYFLTHHKMPHDFLSWCKTKQTVLD